jgi:PAS domain S-box-containing protein
MAGNSAPLFSPATKPVSRSAAGRSGARRARKPAIENEPLVRLLVDSLVDQAIYMLDCRGHVTTWNVGAERTLGYRGDEIIGQPGAKLFTEEDRASDAPRGLLAAAAATGSHKGEGWRVRKDGSRFWAATIVNPVYDVSGRLLGYANVTRDVTEQKRAEVDREAEAARRKLDEATQHIEAIAANFPGMIYRWVWQPDGTIAIPFISPGVTDIYGLEPAAVRRDAAALASRIHPDDSEMVVSAIFRSARNLTQGQIDYRIIAVDGSVKWVRAFGRPSREPDGGLVWDGMVLDVTAQKRVEIELQQSHRNLLEAQRVGNIGHWIADAATQTSEWSPQMFEILGFPVTPRVPYDVVFAHIHPDDRDGYLQARQRAIETHATLKHDYRWTRPDGQVRWIHNEASPQYDAAGKLLRLLGTAQDVTERYQVQERLQAATARADLANRAKSLFLAGMSHELRTPLNAILGFAQMLQLPNAAAFADKVPEYLRHIVSSGEHLVRLIDDLLDLSKIEAGKMSFAIAAVEVSALLADVIETLRPMADKGSILLRLRLPMPEEKYLCGDRTRLLQVLINLGSNAIKYNRPHGQVTIGASVPCPGTLRIAVEDNGLGIPYERQGDLFQAYNRAGAENREIDGTGLGLMLTERLIVAMDGKIGFASQPGRGSCFWVDMPVADA